VVDAAAASEQAAVLSREDLASLYSANYGRLVRLAALLVGDVGTAEDITQEAFIRVLAKRRVVREPDRTLAYLSATVLNLARSRLRRRALAARRFPAREQVTRGPEEQMLGAVEQAAILAALRRLSARQREAVVLRYYAQFSESEAAELMGVSVGAVRAYTARGAQPLRSELEEMP